MKESPIGLEEIALLLGVSYQTVRTWRVRRNGLPTQAGYISGSPYWWTKDVLVWATQTGRWPLKERRQTHEPSEPESRLTEPLSGVSGE